MKYVKLYEEYQTTKSIYHTIEDFIDFIAD